MVGIAIAVAAPYLAPGVLAALGTTTATALALSVTTALIGAALAVTAAVAMKALGLTAGAPKPSSQVGPPQVFRQSIASSFIVYGKRRVGGLLVFFHPRQVGKDHYRYFVIAVAGHRCKGVVSWMLGDETVTVDGSGKVTSGKYANAAWLWFQRGLASETANATFVAECGGKWTAAHKGSGTAAIYAKFQMTDAVVQAGMPNITAVIEGRDEIYDPRDESTGYNRNASLIFYDWMAMPREEGGFGAYEDELPDAAFISAQANVCDETVDGEARYSIDAVITTGAPPAEIRDVMIVNQAGSYTYSGGLHIMRPGYWVPVTNTLSENDLAGPIQVSPFDAADRAANEVQGTFVNPAEGYQGAPFATQSVAAADVRQIDLDLAFTTSPKQAARVASIMLKRAQHEKTVTWPMNIAGLKVKALDNVQADTARYSLSNYAFSVASWSLSSDFGVVLSLREESEDIYGEPGATAVAEAPTVDTADPVTPASELAALVSTSTQVGLTIEATDTTVTISDHVRRYNDKDVNVTGAVITGLTAETDYWFYYDDPAREGGAVAYVPTTDYFAAFPSPDHPDRHYAGYITTDATGGTGTSGGGSLPPGGGGANPYLREV